MSNTPFFKVVVLGQGRVGKTSMSLKFVQNKFDQNQQSTINASYLQKNIILSNGKNVKLAIWVKLLSSKDTAGQEKYNAIAPVYYRDAFGAIVVYQITSLQSFQKVKKWIGELKQYAEKGIIINIAGNKSDMQSMRKIKKIDAQKYASQNNAKHFQVSAKNGMGINEVFTDVCQQIYKQRFSNQQNIVSLKKGKRGMKINSSQEEKKQIEKKKEGCC